MIEDEYDSRVEHLRDEEWHWNEKEGDVVPIGVGQIGSATIRQRVRREGVSTS